MTNLPILQSEVKTMSSKDLLELINQVRQNFGESPVRLNDFNNRIVDELDGQHYESFVVQNLNNTQSTYFNLTIEQCTLVGMRESKGVRRSVLEKLKQVENQKPVLADLSNPVVLRDLLLNYTEQNIALTNENKALNAAIENITNTGEGVKFQQACKTLSIKQAELAKWLRDNKWDRWINKSRASTHYSQERGYCMTKFEEKDGVKASGEPYNYTSIEFFILPKGMAKLAKVFAKEVA